MKKGIVYTIIFTFITAFVFVFLLALTAGLTKEKTELNAVIAFRKGMLNAAGISYSGNEDANEQYLKYVTEIKTAHEEVYIIKEGGRTFYGAVFTGNALWGSVRGIIAVNKEVTRIEGLDVIAHNETPGLGGKIDEAPFKDQFKGETIKNYTINIEGAGSGDTDHSNSKVDGISGATRTSDLFEVMLNKRLETLKDILRGL